MPEIAWPHAPTHRLAENGTFVVTAGTYLKAHHFRESKRLEVLQRGLLKVADEFGWQLEAWAVFSNHYHFIGHSPNSRVDADSLSPMLARLHSKTAIWINQLDQTPGRKVWHNFWETKLSYQRSYIARLHYVHVNAVKHGLAAVANQYPWCSAAWLERTAPASAVKTVYGFKINELRLYDEFTPLKPE